MKRYGDFVAIKDFSVEIESGEFLVLLGPSGCGKTTIIKCISGLIDPTEGQIFIDDILVNKLAPKDRDVAMVFQNYALYPHMNIYSNIAFPLKMRKLSKKEIEDRVETIASLLDISNLLDRKPRELSGGQMQRVALGRALVRKPKVFLLDEPLSNLDAKLRLQMRTEIKKLQKKLKITTIYITHDQIEAMSMADKIVVLDKGDIQQVGKSSDIYGIPKNLFVANFIGNPPINILDFDLIQDPKEGFLLNSSTGIYLKVPIEWNHLRVTDIKKISLGIRPKDINIIDYANDKQKQNKNLLIKAELSFKESLGDDTILEFKLDDYNSIIRVNNPLIPLQELDIGRKAVLAVDYKNIHLFDRETGNRI